MSEEKKPTAGDFMAGVIMLFFLLLFAMFIFLVALGLSVKTFNWIVS